jgi:hypothetical protein
MIPGLSLKESKALIGKGRKSRGPLFNIPSAIETVGNTAVFCVGDDAGRIEFFRQSHSSGNYAWEITRIAVKKVHTGLVTQIRDIEFYDAMFSSSDDGTIAMWQFELH